MGQKAQQFSEGRGLDMPQRAKLQPGSRITRRYIKENRFGEVSRTNKGIVLIYTSNLVKYTWNILNSPTCHILKRNLIKIE